MWAVVLLPVSLLLFGLVAACSVWGIKRYAPSWLQPLADRIKREPATWGYILVFGSLAFVLVVHSFTA